MGRPEPRPAPEPAPTVVVPPIRPLDRPTGWGPTVREWRAARRAVSHLSDGELAGQVIVAAYPGTAPPTGLVKQYHLAGVIVLGDNISSTSAMIAANRRLQAADDRPWPLVISTDQEGGTVQRIGRPLTQFPTFMSYGAAGDANLTEAAARASGEELRAAGFTMVFAPDADVTIGLADPTIGSRSAGDEPRRVATQAVAAERGYQQSGIIPVLKHFPGHGSLTVDSHLALPVQTRTLAELSRRDFIPFAAAARAGADAVMVGHIALSAIDPGVPADLSPPDVALLTNRLGFGGLVTTDALNMEAIAATRTSGEAAVAALRAGVDMLLMPADVAGAYHGILEALRAGSLSRARLENAAAKIVALMMHERDGPAPSASAIGSHVALSERVSAAAITVVSGACRGPYVGRTVTPFGAASVVAAFTTAARAAGLQVGPVGTTIALLGSGSGPADAGVVASLDTPYVLGPSRASVAKVAVFGAGAGAMRALVAVLQGRATPPGRLPVSVQGLDEQSHC